MGEEKRHINWNKYFLHGIIKKSIYLENTLRITAGFWDKDITFQAQLLTKCFCYYSVLLPSLLFAKWHYISNTSIQCWTRIECRRHDVTGDSCERRFPPLIAGSGGTFSGKVVKLVVPEKHLHVLACFGSKFQVSKLKKQVTYCNILLQVTLILAL